MDKFQAINSFWSSYELPAYDENDLPDEAQMPYITYAASVDNIGNNLILSASLWYRSNSWKDISQKAEAIGRDIGYGFKTIKIDDGYMYIRRGTPFAQRMKDEDDKVKRIYINTQVEFLTAE
jgi:hypothetical protein